MTAALVSSNAVVEYWDVIPNPLTLPSGDVIYCAAVGYADNTYTIANASYMDTPPSYPATVLTVNTAVANDGSVQITRTWSSQIVPQSVTNAQARGALISQPSPVNAGKTLLDDVDAAIVASNNAVAKVAWEYSNDIDRNGALVSEFASQLSLTSDQLDALFIAASGIIY